MAANFESGVTYGTRSWHGQENNLAADDPRRWSVEGTLAASGMDWTTCKMPLQIADGQGDLSGVKAEGVFGVFRTDSWQCLGGVGEDYRCLQNVEIFEQFQPFLDCKSLEFTSAGSLDGGRRVYVQARLAQEAADIGGGDLVDPMLLIASSHDGSLATRVGFTPIRVVCMNTLCAAVSRGGLLKIRHTRGQQDALAAVLETVDLARQEFAASVEQYQKLKRLPIGRADLEKFVRVVLEIKPEEKISSRMENQFDRIVSLALRGRGQSIGELTAWSAYNGVTQWVSHERQSDAEQRRKSLWFGASAQTNRRALEAALAMAN